ncbi:hypothetical protein D3C86_1313120 [compost metagenome]
MSGQVEVEIIPEQFEELYTHYPPFGQQGTFLFEGIIHLIGQLGFAEYKCFAQQSAIFGTTDIEGIGQSGYIFQAHII